MMKKIELIKKYDNNSQRQSDIKQPLTSGKGDLIDGKENDENIVDNTFNYFFEEFEITNKGATNDSTRLNEEIENNLELNNINNSNLNEIQFYQDAIENNSNNNMENEINNIKNLNNNHIYNFINISTYKYSNCEIPLKSNLNLKKRFKNKYGKKHIFKFCKNRIKINIKTNTQKKFFKSNFMKFLRNYGNNIIAKSELKIKFNNGKLFSPYKSFKNLKNEEISHSLTVQNIFMNEKKNVKLINKILEYINILNCEKKYESFRNINEFFNMNIGEAYKLYKKQKKIDNNEFSKKTFELSMIEKKDFNKEKKLKKI